MFLSKSSNGRYYIYYFLPSGKRKVKSTGTRRKAEAFKFLTKFKVEREEVENQKVIPITIKELQYKFFRYAEPLFTGKTCGGYKTTFNFLIEHFGNKQISEISRIELEEYFFKRLRGTSIYAANRDYVHISSLFNRAVSDGYLLTNPCKAIKRFKIPEKAPLFYTPEEFQKLINCIDDQHLKSITIFAVNTGLRQMELILLKWRQIDFKEKTLILDNRTYLTKGKRIRVVPLNKNAFSILQKRYNNKAEDIEEVFTLNGKRIEQNYLSHLFKRSVRNAKINNGLNFHSLRHTFASWLVQRGVSIYTVSKLLGHADIATTQIYSHLRREDLRNAADLLNDDESDRPEKE